MADSNVVSCYVDSTTGNVEVIMGFYRAQLLYDVKNYAYIEGHIMQTDNLHQQHTVQDVGEEGNVDRVTRVFDLAIAQCKELLYPYTKSEIENHELSDRLRKRYAYGIVLSLPSDFSQTTVNLLAKLIHEYVVCYAVADWMSITKPEKEEVWKSKVEDMESQIRVALHSRTGRYRRKITLFP